MDYSIIIGLIVTSGGAAVLGLSYLGVYLMGHSRGRREAELEQRMIDQEMGPALHGDRAAGIERALSNMAQAIERLTDAQRVALLDKVRDAEQRRSSVPPQHRTPA